MTQNYLWTDNPTEANVAIYDPDILNECLMHLKYNTAKLTPWCINSASTDSAGAANLLSYSGNTVKFNCGTSLVPIMTSNSQSGWSLTSSHSINTSANDLYKSLDNDASSYCSLQNTASTESPSFVSIEKTSDYTVDFLYLKFASIYNAGDMKNFYIKDASGNTIYLHETLGAFLEKDEFLIPISNFKSTKFILGSTSNVNNVGYTNFPATIKLLDKSQVVTISNPKGGNKAIAEISEVVIPSTASQTFNIYVDFNAQAEALNTPLTKGVALPLSPATNQVHFLNNTEPCTPLKYNGTTWGKYDKIPVGYAKTNSSGVVTEVGTFTYNQNGHNVNANSFSENLTPNGWTKLPNGLIFQWGTVGTFGTALSGNQQIITFAITFPHECLMVGGTPMSNYGSSTPIAYNSIQSWNTSTATFAYTISGRTWWAIGY